MGGIIVGFVINVVVYGAVIIVVAGAGVLACVDLNRDYVKRFKHGKNVRSKNRLTK